RGEVLGIAAQHQALSRRPFLQLEGTAADGVTREVLPPSGHLLGGYRGGKRHRPLMEGQRVENAQDEAERVAMACVRPRGATGASAQAVAPQPAAPATPRKNSAPCERVRGFKTRCMEKRKSAATTGRPLLKRASGRR